MISIPKIGGIGRTYRNLNRYRQILAVLLKYGFGDLLELLKIDQYIEVGLQMVSRKQSVKVEKLSRPQGLRMALEELGPTYIKFGQILSTRPDLVPVAHGCLAVAPEAHPLVLGATSSARIRPHQISTLARAI